MNALTNCINPSHSFCLRVYSFCTRKEFYFNNSKVLGFCVCVRATENLTEVLGFKMLPFFLSIYRSLSWYAFFHIFNNFFHYLLQILPKSPVQIFNCMILFLINYYQAFWATKFFNHPGNKYSWDNSFKEHLNTKSYASEPF